LRSRGPPPAPRRAGAGNEKCRRVSHGRLQELAQQARLAYPPVALTGCRLLILPAAERPRGTFVPVNPLNLIRIMPAEGLDAWLTSRLGSFIHNNKHRRRRCASGFF
jgi:hypothetical protein